MKIVTIDRTHECGVCPKCRRVSTPHSLGHRSWYDFRRGKPLHVFAKFRKYRCPECKKIFQMPMPEVPKHGHYGWGLINAARGYAEGSGKTLEDIHFWLRENARLAIPPTTIDDWLKGRTHGLPAVKRSDGRTRAARNSKRA